MHRVRRPRPRSLPSPTSTARHNCCNRGTLGCHPTDASRRERLRGRVVAPTGLPSSVSGPSIACCGASAHLAARRVHATLTSPAGRCVACVFRLGARAGSVASLAHDCVSRRSEDCARAVILHSSGRNRVFVRSLHAHTTQSIEG
jgi:hypothetical protein